MTSDTNPGAFNDRDYTYEAVMQQLGLIELHTRDGSAEEAGCHCIETKHLRLIEGLSSEGQSFAMSDKESAFFKDLGSLARALRKNLEVDGFDIHAALHEAGLNPGHRAYLPHGLTTEEKESPALQHKLSSCIGQVEKRCCEGHAGILYDAAGHADYSRCSCNPVAVCRKSVEA
jgi:hypothetical protein